MPNQKKVTAVQELEEKLKRYPNLLATAYQGLTTPELNDIRAKLKPLGGQYSIVKNTFTKIALTKMGLEEFSKNFTGPVAMAFHQGDPAALSKVLSEYSKTNEKLKILSGYLDGRVLSAKEIAILATLPSREVLLTKVAICLNQPMQRLATVLNAPIQKLAQLLKAVEQQKAAA